METALATRNVQEITTMAGWAVDSKMYPGLVNRAEAAMKIQRGIELGIGPASALEGIQVIKGKTSLSASLIASLVKRGGYDYRVEELSDTSCMIVFYKGGKNIGESIFTIEDAVKAQIKSDMYAKYPRNMLFARAMSNGARWYCADVFGGQVYTPDELREQPAEELRVDTSTGEVIEAEVVADPSYAPLPTADLADKVHERREEATGLNGPPTDDAFQEDGLHCADCGNQVTAGQRDYSVKAFGRSLCPACQSKTQATQPKPTINNPDEPATQPQVNKLVVLFKQKGFTETTEDQWLFRNFRVNSKKSLAKGQASTAIETLMAMEAPPSETGPLPMGDGGE